MQNKSLLSIESLSNYDSFESASEFTNLYGDLRFIQQQLVTHNKHINTYHPRKFNRLFEAINSIEGTPLKSFIAGNINCFTSLILYPAGSIIASKFTALSRLERRILSSAPLLFGLGRITSGWLTDRGYGKETIIGIEIISLLGIAGSIWLMQHHESQFATVTMQDALFWQAFACNVIQGLSISAYSAGMALSARQAKQDAHLWPNHLKIEEITSVSVHPSLTRKLLSKLIRQGPAVTVALTSAVSNTAPGLGVMLPVLLQPLALQAKDIYFIFAGIIAVSTVGTYAFTANMPYDQLRRKNIVDPVAKEIAEYYGQTSFAPQYHFKDWNNIEQEEILIACIYYSIIYGLLVSICTVGPENLENDGMSQTQARLLIGIVAIISSLFRGIPAINNFGLTPSNMTDLSLIVMLITTLSMQMYPEHAIPAYLLFGVVNGIGNFAVVEKISHSIPSKIGIATSLSTGVAAFLAFFIGIAALECEYTPVILCAFGVVFSASQKISALRLSSLFPVVRPSPSESQPLGSLQLTQTSTGHF